MSEPLEHCVVLLSELIGYRTENPGGDELALCARLADALKARRADTVEVVEVARPGRAPGGYVFARYGTPRLVLNVHLDTVPANTGWSRNPFVATVADDRIYGLGSADIKGAIAAILTVLDWFTPQDVGILFSGDEEAGALCTAAFLASERRHGIERVLVCEPTARKVGIRHRGVRAYRASTQGRGGHSSQADHMPKPVVTMAQVAVGLDEIGTSYLHAGPEDMKGICMNVAGLGGGVAFNVVPDSASLMWSVRPPPGFDMAAFDSRSAALMAEVERRQKATIQVETKIAAEPFACGDVAGFERLLGSRVAGFVPLHFWTEAALFQASGIHAVVVGPGDIAQAHAPDEYVTLADLDWVMRLFAHALRIHSDGDA